MYSNSPSRKKKRRRHQLPLKNISVNKHNFAPDEDALLKTIVLASPTKNWRLISTAFGSSRSLNEIFRRHLELSGCREKTPWSERENQLLRSLVGKYGENNWYQVSMHLEDKSSYDCFHQWKKRVNHQIVKGKWSHVEDVRLIVSTRVFGTRNWSRVAQGVFPRTDIQCRERYCNILDPKLKHDEWDPEEDMCLMNYVREYGEKWALISKKVGNRTDNQCWRRWKMLRRPLENLINSSAANLREAWEEEKEMPLQREREFNIEKVTRKDGELEHVGEHQEEEGSGIPGNTKKMKEKKLQCKKKEHTKGIGARRAEKQKRKKRGKKLKSIRGVQQIFVVTKCE